MNIAVAFNIFAALVNLFIVCFFPWNRFRWVNLACVFISFWFAYLCWSPV